MAKHLCFISNLLRLLSVEPYGAVISRLLSTFVAVVVMLDSVSPPYGIKKNDGGISPAASTLELAGQGWSAPTPSFSPSVRYRVRRSAGSPSEVTALETRHWITSFHC